MTKEEKPLCLADGVGVTIRFKSWSVGESGGLQKVVQRTVQKKHFLREEQNSEYQCDFSVS